MTQDIFNQELSDHREWNKKFLSNDCIKKLTTFGVSRDYYAYLRENKIVELYSIDEGEHLIREPLSTLQVFPHCVPDSQMDGFWINGIHYTEEEVRKDLQEIIRFENS